VARDGGHGVAFLDKRDIASGLVPAIWDACGAERPRPGRR
jgi:hypothetical protein